MFMPVVTQTARQKSVVLLCSLPRELQSPYQVHRDRSRKAKRDEEESDRQAEVAVAALQVGEEALAGNRRHGAMIHDSC